MKTCLYCGEPHNRRSAYCKDSHRTRYNEKKRGQNNPVNKLVGSPKKTQVDKLGYMPDVKPKRSTGIVTEGKNKYKVIPAKYQNVVVPNSPSNFGKWFGIIGTGIALAIAPKGKKIETVLKWGGRGLIGGLAIDAIRPKYIEQQVMVQPERKELIQSMDNLANVFIEAMKGSSTRVHSRDYRNAKIEKLSLNPKYRTLFGNPAKDFYMMVDGLPGHGKSYWAMQFAEYFNREVGNVVYYAAEQNGLNVAFQEMQNQLGTTFIIEKEPKKLSKKKIAKDFQDYDLIVIDSINEMGLEPDELKELRSGSNAAVLGILQSTKDGQFKGSQEWLHDVGISIKLQNYIPNVIKTRYRSIHDDKDHGRVVNL